MNALLLILALSLGGEPLPGYERHEAPTGPLFSRGWAKSDRELVEVWSHEALLLARERLECAATGGFQIVLCPDLSEFRRVVRAFSTMNLESDQILGVAIPRKRTLVIRGGLSPRFGNVRPTVVHEVAHLVLHEQAATLPRWLDEGIASWLSGRALTLDDQGYLAFLARTGGLYRLAQLETRFPGGHLSTAAAYQQSLHFVTFLADTYGADAPARLVARLRAHPTVDSGRLLPAVCGREVAEVEKQFRGWVRARVSLGTMWLAVLQPWTVAAVLAVIAIVRHSWRRRRRLAQLAREEPPESSTEREGGQSDAADEGSLLP